MSIIEMIGKTNDNTRYNRPDLYNVHNLPGGRQHLTLTLNNVSFYHFNEDFLFGLRLYVPVNNFSVMSGRFSMLNQYLHVAMKMLSVMLKDTTLCPW